MASTFQMRVDDDLNNYSDELFIDRVGGNTPIRRLPE